MSFNIIRNANVECQVKGNGKGYPSLSIVVNGLYGHTFSENSRESRMLLEHDMKTIEMLMNGGTYVFYGDKLVDYRGSGYRGYIQSDEAVKHLQEIIGFEMARQGGYTTGVNGLFKGARSSRHNSAMFGGEWDRFDLEVPSLGEGGEMEGHLMLNWSVFSDKISTSLNVKRLVCQNGMVADSPFVTFEVPIINRWEENLDIVSARLKPVMSETMAERFEQMSESRASVSELITAHQIIANRMKSDFVADGDANYLARLERILNPEKNLGGVYRDAAMNDKHVSAELPGHLMQYDVFNILTEATSHYGRDLDNDSDARRFLNRLTFDNLSARGDHNFKLNASSDSDHRRAFFGK